LQRHPARYASSGCNSVPGAIARAGLLIATIALLAACSAGTAALQEPSPVNNPEWPLGDTGERIEWVRNIAESRDLGSAGGFWRRIREMVAGADKHGLVTPYGVLVDKARRLYVTDPGARVVHCTDMAKGRYFAIGGEGAPLLRTPIGLAQDERGRVYITDSTLGMVFRYDPEDASLKPLLAKRLGRPTGIAFHPQNHLLYVADTLASQIVAVDQGGVERKRIGSQGEEAIQFNRPTDITINARGEILVLDALNFRISVLSPEGQLVRQFGEPGDAMGYFSRPKGIAVDSSDNIYVGDSQRDMIQVFDDSGSLISAFGKSGVGRGRFWMPSGIFIDSRDYIYVADTYNRRIQIFRHLTNRENETQGEPDFERAQ
jgi:sugar lactone lactonase YvrE